MKFQPQVYKRFKPEHDPKDDNELMAHNQK
jgi:hypothetical protein